MDPISALLLSGVLTMLLARTVAAGVTDTIAQAKGQTPPSLEKWRKRQADRAARGAAPEKDPGPLRRRWRNAVEEYVAKAAQKHRARMEHLTETAPENIAKHREKLRKRAERWDQVNATLACWGAASWEAAKQNAAKVKDYLDERQAWKENERRAADQTDTGEDPATPASTTADGPDAAVLPFRRPDPEKEDPTTTNDTPPTSATTEGNPLMSTPQNTATEITDLDTAISYSQETARYTDTVGSTLTDVTAQLDAAMQGLTAEAAAYEQARASLAGEGFGAKVTSRFDVAAEALHAAADALKTAIEQLSSASEQVTTAGGEMRGAIQTFSDQLAISENLGAARQDAGVSTRTDFYAPV